MQHAVRSDLIGLGQVWQQVNSTARFRVLAFLGDFAFVRRTDTGNGNAFWRPADGLYHCPDHSTPSCTH